MKVLLAGDTHGNSLHVLYLLDVAKARGCDRVVQVGDFGYWPHLAPFHERVNEAAMRAGITWYWLDGNHENFDALADAVDVNAAEPQQMLSNLWYLPRASTWEWDGCRFLALGGACSIDKDHRVEGVSWWRQELITRDQVECALDRGVVDVMLTHDAPDGVCPIVSLDFRGDHIGRGNRKAVSAVMVSAAPRLLVHGHYHHRYTARTGKTKVEGLDRDGTMTKSWIVIQPAAWTAAALE